jgi:hypothetical protein
MPGQVVLEFGEKCALFFADSFSHIFFISVAQQPIAGYLVFEVSESHIVS